MNRVKMVYTGSDSKAYLNQYVYENDLLKEVRHNTAGAALADLDAVETVTHADDVAYSFEYDSKNRRTGVKVGSQYLSKNEYDDTAGPQYGVLARSIYCNSDANPQVVHYTYTYDVLGQLTRVDDTQENATWVYTYDQGGNILSKKKYALGVTSGTAVESKTFTYGNSNWKDQLTAVNGTPITYDNIGNPTNDGTWEYEWEKGCQLKKMVKTGETVEFKYNENGLRIQKVATSTGTTNYTLHGKNIVHMTQGSNSLHFYYDASNKPAIVEFNGTKYAYVHNLQGDIVAILDSNKNVVVSYVYDAWGRPINCSGIMASTLGKINPFRYRGYVYDEETGFYYVSSRYYDPEIGRWINADGYVSTGQGVLGNNMFAYCGNNPVNRVDHTGQFWSEIWEFAQTAVAEIGKAMGVMSPAYAGCGGVAVADGPLPFGDIVAAAGAALLTVGAIGYGIY